MKDWLHKMNGLRHMLDGRGYYTRHKREIHPVGNEIYIQDYLFVKGGDLTETVIIWVEYRYHVFLRNTDECETGNFTTATHTCDEVEKLLIR